MKRNKLHTLAFYSTTPYYLLCRMPVKSMSDLRGKRIRGTGPWGVWINAMGATPVNITNTEVYEGMERGQLDCSVGSVAWLEAYALYDVTKSVIDMPVGAYIGGNLINMNADKWAKLSTAEKSAMRKHLATAVVNAVAGYEGDDQVSMEKGKAKNIAFVPPPEELKKQLAEHQKKELDRVAALGERRGVKDAGALVKRFAESLEKWKGIYAEVNGDKAAFAQRMQTEIFDKAGS
jgi:TRAP-type C4-dicarboxylate transport system substrate-binding protein